MSKASFKYGVYPVFAVLTLSMFASCGSDIEIPAIKVSSLYSSFTLNEIVASDDAVKQMVLSWEAASDVTGVTYTICRSSDAESTSCDEELTSVTDELTATITVDSLVNTLANAYYTVQASHDGFDLYSNTVEISSDTVTEMIGYFKASNTGADDWFGYSVALSADGSTLAVGAYGEDNSARGVYNQEDAVTDDDESSGSGAVYVFTLEDGAWQQSAYLKGSNSSDGASFGLALAFSDDGTRLVVGAPYEDDPTSGVITDGSEAVYTGSDGINGAVYLFELSSNAWSQVVYFKASAPDMEDAYGYAVAISGDGRTLVVGAPEEDNLISGVVTDGSEVIDVGDYGDIEGKEYVGVGAVYVYSEVSGAWAQDAYVKASNPSLNDDFGRSLSLNYDGTLLAVGAPYEDNSATGIITDGSEADGDQDDATSASSGAVYLFEYASESGWAQAAYIKAPNSEAGDIFGCAVSLNAMGDVLAVGSLYEDNGSAEIIDLTAGDTIEETSTFTNSGAVYIYSYADAAWGEAAYIKASNVGSLDYFGSVLQLSAAGDQLLVGAYFEDSANSGVTLGSDFSDDDTATNAGAAYLFSAVDGVWQQSAYLKASNTESSDLFGSGIAMSADGSVIAIGAYLEDNSISGVLTDGSEIDGDYGTVSAPGAVYLY
ncbi:FG-GAP repeat protein [Reinekea marinisedimentorum]|uniref:FG-GAP repeat protein n=1 Tax=Reinekea marinisedimentorum TaxID=230495 RepID=A0A4R3I4L1_9GAMM|nr:FG-GAP repeat protein [Reinekea marinisedimentorum]TCS40023.1 FG-GAP repeat protein [Reinekea marinisedimentorum]